MEKKGAVSLTTKVIIGLVVSITILFVLFLIWGKIWAILLPQSDEEVFQVLITKIENLKKLEKKMEEDKKEPVDYINYFLTKKHFLVGFDQDIKEYKTPPPWIRRWRQKTITAPLGCEFEKETESEKKAICICKCDEPIEEGSCKDHQCRVIEGFSHIEYYKDEKKKEDNLLLEPGSRQVLELSKKEDKLIIKSLV